VELDGQPIPVLLTALQHPVNGVRQRARVELSERPTSEVISEMEAWIAQWDPSEPEHAHHLLEALWLHQQHNVENQDLLDLVLNSPVAHARIAARTVERMWEHNTATPVRMSAAAATEPAAGARPDLGDDAIVIKTVMEQMRYDIPAFTVAAGATVTILFDNEDYTPHNLVIAQPGSGEAVGTAADALGAQGFVKQFIPDSDEIIVASDLLSYGEFEVLTFTAPTEPADYEVLCTFPGHRGTMHGIMTVEQ
jgi:azurin